MEKSGNDNNLNFFKSILLFNGNKSKPSDDDSPKPISRLSPLANSVVSRCSKILQEPTEELQYRFEAELPDTVKQPSTYARNFVEFCSYQALYQVTMRPDYLSDKEFRRLTYDMMLAWEAPGVENEPLDTCLYLGLARNLGLKMEKDVIDAIPKFENRSWAILVMPESLNEYLLSPEV
ncbi:hypothetical protein U1Q18_001734 [Sarracenia purpurea var. burkii]